MLFFAGMAQAGGTILVWGDSLSAGYGLEKGQDWPTLLQTRLDDKGFRHVVVNASVSGETSSGGRSRLPAALEQHAPDIVILELGANDGLRGLPLAQTRANLERMIKLSQASGAKVMLIGMRMPPNLGREYTEGFERNYRELAQKYSAPLLPFLLEPVAADRNNFQNDNLHPTAAAQPALRDHVWTKLGPMLK